MLECALVSFCTFSLAWALGAQERELDRLIRKVKDFPEADRDDGHDGEGAECSCEDSRLGLLQREENLRGRRRGVERNTFYQTMTSTSKVSRLEPAA